MRPKRAGPLPLPPTLAISSGPRNTLMRWSASSLTNSFGYYTVDKLDSGTTYIVTATGRSYTFTPQTLFVTDAMTNVNFVAVR